MNKSVNFINQRIKEYGLNISTNRIETYKPLDVFKEINKIYKKIIDKNNSINTYIKEHNIKVNIEYDPNANFDYMTMEEIVCDGTVMFVFELFEKILYKLMSAGTHYIPKVNDDYTPINKHIKYTIGDFVLSSQYDENLGIEEKPWCTMKFSLMLPIKFEYEENL